MVTVTRIDRLARSTFDLFAIVKQIVDTKPKPRNQRGLSWCYTSISDPLATPRVIRRSDNEERVAAARTPG